MSTGCSRTGRHVEVNNPKSTTGGNKLSLQFIVLIKVFNKTQWLIVIVPCKEYMILKNMELVIKWTDTCNSFNIVLFIVFMDDIIGIHPSKVLIFKGDNQTGGLSYKEWKKRGRLKECRRQEFRKIVRNLDLDKSGIKY